MSTSSTKQSKDIFSQTSHSHGGQLKAASKKYGIPVEDWLDLSTGINPNSYPLPQVPNKVWQCLPEIHDGLEDAASQYYGSKALLATAGSQEAIQDLPAILTNTKGKKLRVGILKPAYHSHQQAWEKLGYKVEAYSKEQITPTLLEQLDVLTVVNPTNPTTTFFRCDLLLEWHQALSEHNGLLIVDEAFIDATPEHSLIQKTPIKGLIVLRSVGKFFGLAGIRLGFVWATNDILQALENQQNDWSVSHPARWAGIQALSDKIWQESQRKTLPHQADQIVKLLEDKIFNKPLINGGVYFNTTNQHVHSTTLFSYFEHPRAEFIYQQLVQQGILVRLFKRPPALRFGLPASKKEWLKLSSKLNIIQL